jgi:hypothetical protein
LLAAAIAVNPPWEMGLDAALSYDVELARSPLIPGLDGFWNGGMETSAFAVGRETVYGAIAIWQESPWPEICVAVGVD